MNFTNPPFYPNETLAGHVVQLNHWFAVVNVRGWQLPLEKRFICWDVIKTTSEALSIGERIQVVVHTQRAGKEDYPYQHLYPTLYWHGFWLNRLSLLESPSQKFQAKYPEGSIIEVEFIEYVNFYTARAIMPDGAVIEVLQRDIHPKSSGAEFERSVHTGQLLRLKVKRFHGHCLLAKRLI